MQLAPNKNKVVRVQIQAGDKSTSRTLTIYDAEVEPVLDLITKAVRSHADSDSEATNN